MSFKAYQCRANVKAKAMTLGAYNKYKGWELPADENGDDRGVLVIRQDDSETWVPFALFKETHVKM